MIDLETALKKLDEFKLKDETKKSLTDVLNRKKSLGVPFAKDVIDFVQNRLAQPHLKYLEQNQVDGKWGIVSSNALSELCANHSVRFDGQFIGQTVLLCLLDGSIPSKKARTSVYGKNLSVVYYSQRDSNVPGQAFRMCFSSSCAMKLHHANPALLNGHNADDDYLRRVLQYGDTTEAHAQVQAMRSYGLKAEFRQTWTLDDVFNAIKNNKPVVALIYHKGSIKSLDRSGGHAIVVKGVTHDGKGLYVNDPFGELDLVSGNYVSTDGANKVYSVENFMTRWTDGTGQGWAII